MATEIKVLIVDDHAVIRIGLSKLLSEQAGIKVVGEAGDGEQALKIVKEAKPDVVLMDIKMPGMGGLEATKRLLRHHPMLKIVIVSACDEEPLPTRLLQAGAAGFISKNCDMEELLQAIRKTHSGQRYIAPEIAQKMALKKVSHSEESPFEKLSERELQVMLMIVHGQKVQEISDKLCLSPKTVNSYRYRLFEKLKVSNDVELTHLAIRHGLFERFPTADGIEAGEVE